ncbi:MAG: hypothetical protein IIA89_14125 [Chloroflexi bacterium]|nr:hypothetical protein [Chloroflexota bacterium]
MKSIYTYEDPSTLTAGPVAHVILNESEGIAALNLVMHLRTKTIQDAVPKPSRLNPSMKPALEQVILKTLAKSPDDRFKDMNEPKRAYDGALVGVELP